MSLVDIVILIGAVILVVISVRSFWGAAKKGECASCRRRSSGCGSSCSKCAEDSQDSCSSCKSCDKCKK